MPRIPDVEAPISSLQAPASPRLGPAQFGEGEATALEKLGNSIEDTTQRLDGIYQETKANQASTGAQKELQDYALQLKTGTTDPSTGEVMPPPDPATHAQLFQQKVDEVRQATESSLAGNGHAINKFHDDYNGFADRALLDVKSNAVSFMHQSIRANAQMDWQNRASTSINASDIERPQIEQAMSDDVDRMVQSRVITPEEGFAEKEKFYTEVEVGHIRRMIVTGDNGPRDVINAIKSGEFSKLRNDVQERWLDIATRMQTANDNRDNIRAQKDERDIERLQHQGADRAYEEAIDKQRNGTLDADWLMQNRGRLLPNPSHYKAISDMIAGGKEAPSNKELVGNVHVRFLQGEDATKELEDGYANGSINSSDRTKLWEVAKNVPAVQASMWRRGGAKAISSAMDGMHTEYGMPVAGKAIAKTDALAAWSDWSEAHKGDNAGKGPTPDEAQGARDQIIRNAAHEARITTPERVLPVPKFVVGGRNALYDEEHGLALIQQADQKTADAFRKGQLTKDEAAKEFTKIKAWMALFPKKPAASGAVNGK